MCDKTTNNIVVTDRLVKRQMNPIIWQSDGTKLQLISHGHPCHFVQSLCPMMDSYGTVTEQCDNLSLTTNPITRQRDVAK